MTQALTVREARERHKPPMTQEELADRSGFDQTYISLIERGRRVPKEPDTKKRLAKALGIAPSKLRFSEPRPATTVDPASDSLGHSSKVKTPTRSSAYTSDQSVNRSAAQR